jgi:hypothetical protein
MFDHNQMRELAHIKADRYQRNGGGGGFKVHQTAAAFHKSRGYDQMSSWDQLVYRARVQFKSVCELAQSDFLFAPVAFDLAKEERKEANRYAIETIPF